MGHLPAEIWCHIADYLPPNALDAITSTSTTLRRMLLPSPALKRHHALKKQYGSCMCGLGQPNGELTRLVVDVFLRPELSLYVKELTIINWYSHISGCQWKVFRSLSRNGYQEALDAAQQGTECLQEYLCRLCVEKHIFILLLWALPELRSLHILGWPSRDFSARDSVASDIGEMIEQARGIGDESCGPFSPQILPSLHRIWFGSPPPNETWPVRTIDAFAGLPNVKEIITPENSEEMGNKAYLNLDSFAIKENSKPLRPAVCYIGQRCCNWD